MCVSVKEIVFEELKKSKKYRYLCDDTLYRISQWAAQRFDEKKAAKAAKNKLHQVYGAYLINNPGKIRKLLEQLTDNIDTEHLRAVALEILKYHTSTLERIEFMEQFYHDLSRIIGKPRKILDLACGLNPFAVPWMELEPGSVYHAFDIDKRLISLINSFFDLNRFNGIYRAQCADIMISIPGIDADVVFLFKTLPCLEQQEKGISQKLLASLRAKFTVISFPSRSLTGKSMGMEKHYFAFFQELINHLNSNYSKLEYPNEIFYILQNNK